LLPAARSPTLTGGTRAWTDFLRELADHGITPVVTFGPGEEELALAVERRCPSAKRAPPTDLDELAELMRQAQLVVCNNTGPMHLAVAVGTPTLAFFLHMEVERWGHTRWPHQMVDLTAAVASGEAERLAASAARGFLSSLEVWG